MYLGTVSKFSHDIYGNICCIVCFCFSRHRDEIIRFQSGIHDPRQELSVCQNEIFKLKDEINIEIDDLKIATCNKQNEVNNLKEALQLVTKTKKHCKQFLAKALITEVGISFILSPYHRVVHHIVIYYWIGQDCPFLSDRCLL